MKYFEEIDAWLTSLLEELLDEPSHNGLSRVKSAIKNKILESYRNGQKAGMKPAAESERQAEPSEEEARSRYPKRGSFGYRKPSR